MSADKAAKRPVVVKHGGHEEEEHGGQWKVAYADFVTAMMAFFLIMWLLSSTTSSQREGIAKFFNTATILDMSSGDGMLDGGRSIMDGADAKTEKLTVSREDGGIEGNKENAPAQSEADLMALFKDRVERQRFEAAKAELGRMMQQGELKEFADNLQIEMTPEGLRIQIFDRDGQAMFPPGSADPTPRFQRILGVISQVLMAVQNPVVLTGYTDAQPLQRPGYTNWELSADRANAARRVLAGKGIADDRFMKVEGRASTSPLLPQAPNDPRNRRVAITILRSDIVAQMRGDGHLAKPAGQP